MTDTNRSPTLVQTEAQFRHALSLAPHDAALKRNFGIFLGQRGHELRAQGELEAAANALREAVTLAPNLANAWGNLGSVLRLLGRSDEALAAFHQSQRLGVTVPEVENAVIGTLEDAGRLQDAFAGARKLVASRPDFVPGYETLAHLLWKNGDTLALGEDPLHAMREAARAQPGNAPLRLALVRMLLTLKRADVALAELEPLRRSEPNNPVLAWFAADALDALGQPEQASLLFEQAAVKLGDLGAFLNAHAQHAFRRKQIELAHAIAQRAVRLDASNEEAWSHLGTAWRLLGDEREHWLHGYDTLIGCLPVELPAGYANMDAFLAALTQCLDAMHQADREPMDQSVRGGSQTAGLLFGRKDKLIGEAQETLCGAIETWLAALPDDPRHPFLARKRASVRFVGSWSVRLKSSGRHSNHIHPMGWASSAFYVALPRAVREADASSQAGWIQFGSPLESLGLDLPPRRVIQPQPGHLALFPSYTWHGTVPFEDEEPRLTIAFDMQPK